MSVIDVDSHFEPGNAWLLDYPDLLAKVPPPSIEHRLAAVFSDLLADVPVEQHPSPEALRRPGHRVLTGAEKLEGFEDADPLGGSDAAARVVWLDKVGIDLQNVICLEGLFLARNLSGPLRQEAVHACNDWLANVTDQAGGRLMPVTALDLADVDAAVEELTLMRARGSRSFLIPGIPVEGRPVMHPEFDRLWSAATDLGMVAMLHVGSTPARFHPGYANTAGDMYAFRQVALSQGHQAAQVLLNSMVFGGVFERHPTLTLLLCELNVGWLPYTVEHMDSRVTGEITLVTGEYPFPLLPSEYVQRNVRITPIPRAHQSPVPLLEQLPDCAVFSSDYPHFEGSPRPTEFYGELLEGVDATSRAAFLSGNFASVFERMGDPLVVAR